MSELYAIRPVGDDSLQHWKYIKKVKTKNGKWRYIYDTSELKKYESGREETKISNGPNAGEYKVKYRQSNDLFDGNFTSTSYGRNRKTGKRYTYQYRIKTQGRISRASARGEKFIYDNVLKSKSTEKRKSRAITNGARRFIKDVINA